MKKINETKNNKKANSIINKIFEEMKYAEEYLKKLNISRVLQQHNFII